MPLAATFAEIVYGRSDSNVPLTLSDVGASAFLNANALPNELQAKAPGIHRKPLDLGGSQFFYSDAILR